MRHMLHFARRGVAIAKGKRCSDLDTDEVLVLALCRLVELIGEAASHVPEERRARHPQIPWAQMIGMRNRLIHGYDFVDTDIVWDTARDDLPALVAELERIIPLEGG
jgi:uncharacterized protein with HEPN domain